MSEHSHIAPDGTVYTHSHEHKHQHTQTKAVVNRLSRAIGHLESVRKMVEDLRLPLEIVACPIVRDDDGLALSSRNVYLSPQEREIALCIPRTIYAIESAIAKGVYEVSALEHLARENLTGVHIFYAYFCDRALAPITHIRQGESLFLLAVRVGRTRLLDNLWC